jgi:hypothetical protein
MKFVLAFVVLASVAAVNAAPGTFFGDTEEFKPLEDIQVNNKKIKLAAADIEVTEGKLATLAAAADQIDAATTLLTTAADKSVYTANEFTHESQA